MSIHAMSDDEFEEFDHPDDSEVTEWDEELSCTVESREEYYREYEAAHWDETYNPDEEDNYDDVAVSCDSDRDIPSPDVLGPVADVWGDEDPTIDDPTIPF